MECEDAPPLPRGSKVTGADSQASSPAGFESSYWSRPGPIRARAQVISTAPPHCTRRRGEEEEEEGKRSGAGIQSVEEGEKLCC